MREFRKIFSKQHVAWPKTGSNYYFTKSTTFFLHIRDLNFSLSTKILQLFRMTVLIIHIPNNVQSRCLHWPNEK